VKPVDTETGTQKECMRPQGMRYDRAQKDSSLI
jgi:hypothetical protein